MSNKINNIVNKIELDISSRCGLGDEWSNIDMDIKEEIRENWKDILIKGLEFNDNIPNDILELSKDECLDLLYSYDDYIKDNIENNEEFGKSWYPVCINEFFDNEYKNIKGID